MTNTKKASLRQAYSLLTRKEKWQIFIIIFFLFFGSLFEVLGIGAILPYLDILLHPEKTEQFKILLWAKQWLQAYHVISNQNGFFIFLTLLVILIYAIKNIFLTLSQYIQISFSFKVYQRLSTSLFHTYLHLPYTFHLQKNTADLIRNLSQMTLLFVNAFLFPSLLFLSESFIVLLLLLFLFKIDYFSTLYVLLLLGSTVSLLYFSFRNLLKRIGENNVFYQGKVNQQIMQGMGGIKEAKVLKKEDFFEEQFDTVLQNVAQSQKIYNISREVPRYFLELLIVVVMLSLTIFFLSQGTNIDKIIITLAIFGMGGIRLLPSMNRLLNALSSLKFSTSAFAVLAEDLSLRDNLEAEEKKNKTNSLSRSQNFIFKKTLTLKNIFFRYDNSSEYALEKVNLSIKQGSTVGFVGHSGAGKSTIIDIILGLLQPVKGEVLVDGENIQSFLNSWQKNIGYIPQSIYLSDENIRANIAFGVSEKEIDEDKVQQAIHLSRLSEFIDSLPQKADTVIGEHGVRLSGGQRQRIGIARALYHNPRVLVMDEATAALDNQTEKEVMKAIENLHGQKTILMIAHRLSTVRNCDVIFYMKKGKVLAKGSYQELLSKNNEFQKLAES